MADPVGTLASNIINLRLILSNGTIINANNTFNKQIFDASRISFGVLGIISEVTIKAKPISYMTRYEDLMINGQNNLSLMIDTIYNHSYLYYNLSGSDSGFAIFGQTFHASRYMNIDFNDDDADIYNYSCWGEASDIKPCTDVYYKAKEEPNFNFFTLNYNE
eukprot:402596_1